ncbi:MAG TPA: MBL fold metallo-hydrolase [Vicinamibacterales bacterium]|nr:MBL fold metallo-hydrolase [Vicinamibacterales bacterium]
MTRTHVLGLLVMLGAASIGAAAYQQPAPNAPKVIEVDRLKPNLFVLKGGGGNTAVFVTAAGVVVVDAKNPGWGQPILDKIKELTDKPVTMLINTHTHGDHVGGNVEFPASVEVVAQANTKANMEKMDIFTQNANRGLAKRTFTDKMTLGAGADQIDLYYFGPGHTNGDAWVVFPALRTAHVGDIFASKGLPLIDGANGGSVLHIHETLNKAYAGIRNVDTVINGHSNTTMTWADVKQFADFNQEFL